MNSTIKMRLATLITKWAERHGWTVELSKTKFTVTYTLTRKKDFERIQFKYTLKDPDWFWWCYSNGWSGNDPVKELKDTLKYFSHG